MRVSNPDHAPFAIYRRNAIGNAVDYAKIRSRSHNAVIHVYDGAGNAVETHARGRFKES